MYNEVVDTLYECMIIILALDTQYQRRNIWNIAWGFGAPWLFFPYLVYL